MNKDQDLNNEIEQDEIDQLHAEDEIYGDATADFSTEEEQADSQQESAEGVQTQPEEVQVEPTEEGKPDLAKQISAEVTAAIKATQPVTQEQQQKQITPEERDKLLRRVQATGDLIQRLGFDDPTPEQVLAFQEVFDSVAQHAYTMAEARLLMAQRELDQRLEPVQSFYQQQQIREAEQFFYSKYPVLKEYPTAVQEAAKKVNPKNADGSYKSNDQIAQEVSLVASDFIKQFNKDFDMSKATPSATAQTRQVQSSVPRMTSGMTGGRSQGGTSSDASSNDPDADIYA